MVSVCILILTFYQLWKFLIFDAIRIPLLRQPSAQVRSLPYLRCPPRSSVGYCFSFHWNVLRHAKRVPIIYTNNKDSVENAQSRLNLRGTHTQYSGTAEASVKDRVSSSNKRLSMRICMLHIEIYVGLFFCMRNTAVIEVKTCTVILSYAWPMRLQNYHSQPKSFEIICPW